MTKPVDLYDSYYGNFTSGTQDAIRKETFGTDIGQNSWVTVDEYERWLPMLELGAGSHVLDVASGSGGPARYVARSTGCRVTGIDANEGSVATASSLAAQSGESGQVQFTVADATAKLPCNDGSFDAVLCIDAMNHFPNRLAVLEEWRRVLRGGGRALFTDPVVISGPVTNEELALRSSIGLFLFVPPGVNERLIEQAGLKLIRQEDVTGNVALTSGRWHRARQARKTELIRIEGEERYSGLQRFFDTVHALSSQGRLSRIAYLAQKP